MDWNTVKGNWHQFTGEARKQWGEMTHDESQQIKGERDKLVGWIEEKYGETKETAEKQVDTWMQSDSMKKAMASFDQAKAEVKEKMADMSASSSTKSDSSTKKT